MSADIATRLGAFVHDLRYDAIPPAAVEKARQLILDQLGGQVAAAHVPWSTIVHEHARESGAPGKATVVSHGTRLAPEWAVFCNATFGHGLEVDDYHSTSLAHPGCLAVPAALALAEDRRASGRDVIVSVVAGAEVLVRLGAAFANSALIDRGFHPTSLLGPFAAAVSAAKLLGLSAERIAAALGIGASHSSGTTQYGRTGGDVKRLHAGLGAMGGVRAAQLAARGFTAPGLIFEGERGVFQAFANTYSSANVLTGLGDRFEMADTSIKFYACCGLIHPQLEAAAACVASTGAPLEEIESLVVGTSRAGVSHTGHGGPEPHDLTEAQFSARYSVALGLVRGSSDLPTYLRERDSGFADRTVVELAKKVDLVHDEECERLMPNDFGANVEIKLRDGRTFAARVADARGSRTRPATWAEVREKFMQMAGDLPRRDAVVDAVEHLEQARSVDELMANTVGAGR